jgi:hypothetical protein
MIEELRRIPRLSVCCRVMVNDRYGVWSAVTENISARGCRIVSSRLLRRGTRVQITFSSDLFPDDLEATGEVAWATGERLGVVFVDGATRAGARSPAAWLNKVLEHGATPDSPITHRVVPSVSRRPAPAPAPEPAPIGFVPPLVAVTSSPRVTAQAVAPAPHTIHMTARARR